MNKEVNCRIVLASRPNGEPTLDNFKLVENPIPEPGKDEMLLRTVYLSLDPYMRGRMNDGPSYAAPVQLNEVMVGGTVCRVVKSSITEFKIDDFVLAGSGWLDYFVTTKAGVQLLDNDLNPKSYALGVLGMPGFTAYVGLTNIGKPKQGETLVVAAASGAVGSIVGQIAKIKGCRVVGIAGGGEEHRTIKGIFCTTIHRTISNYTHKT